MIKLTNRIDKSNKYIVSRLNTSTTIYAKIISFVCGNDGIYYRSNSLNIHSNEKFTLFLINRKRIEAILVYNILSKYLSLSPF